MRITATDRNTGRETRFAPRDTYRIIRGLARRLGVPYAKVVERLANADTVVTPTTSYRATA